MYRELWTRLTSTMGALVFLHTILHSVLPPEVHGVWRKLFHRFYSLVSSYCYFEITEMDGVSPNELYHAVKTYLSSFVSANASRLTLTRQVNSSSFTCGLSNNDRLIDNFHGIEALWEHVVDPWQNQDWSHRLISHEKRGFILRTKKKHKSQVLNGYLDFIMEKAREIRRKNLDRLLYTNSGGRSMDYRSSPWESVPFKHPSTFDTLAMDPIKKEEIMADLRSFADGESFYQKTGRAWKRGYLLYGPPGTGKSSMIAAMANYLRYDIYDLELSEVRSNSELRKLLMKTTAKSIVVIEDIDCSISLSSRTVSKRNNVRDGMPGASGSPEDGGSDSITLSGLLSFTDGLWSCCGSEKIFVFTTNHIEKLDPALLRSGRMDMHVYMGYCSFEALKVLVKNYLDLEMGQGHLSDDFCKALEAVIQEAEITPADVTEILIKNRCNHEKAVSRLIEALEHRAKERRLGRALGSKVNSEENLEEAEEQEKRELEVNESALASYSPKSMDHHGGERLQQNASFF